MSRTHRLLRRGLFAVFAFWVVVSITFGLVALTGDPNEAVVEYQAAVESAQGGGDADQIREDAEAAVAAYREARNLNEPVTTRYLRWLSNVASLDLGNSYQFLEPVTTLVADRLAITLAYALPGLAVAICGGLAVGTYAAVGRRPILTRVATVASYSVFGIPNFWIASVAISVCAYQFGILSLTGYELERAIWSAHNLRRLVLPAMLIGTGLVAGQARYTRAEVATVRGESFVNLAHAKGLSELQVAWRILRVALLPLVTLTFSKLLGLFVLNVFVIEFVFDLPGFGQLTYNAILARDLPLIIGTTLAIAAIGIVGNFVQDAVDVLLDPRVDDGQSGQ